MLESELRIAFANMGVDYDTQTPEQRQAVIDRVERCGSCACIFYTGHTVYDHSCPHVCHVSVFSHDKDQPCLLCSL